MSTDMQLFAGVQLPAHMRAPREPDALTSSLAGTSGGSYKRISVEGGVFRLIVDGKEIAKNTDRSINVVVVNAAPVNNRLYYDPKVPYTKGQPAAPVCSSADGVKPDARIKTPMAKSCAECPQNIKGSGNGDSRACRYQRRLAVVMEGDLDGDVYQMTMAATSIFGKGENGLYPLQEFAGLLKHNNTSINQIVTKLSFDTDASVPKLFFSPARPLTDAEYAIVSAKGDSQEALQCIDLGAYQMDTAKAATAAIPAPVQTATPTPAPEPAPKSGGFVPSAAPAVDESAADVEEVPAPTKAKKAKADAPVTADMPKMTGLLDAWGGVDD